MQAKGRLFEEKKLTYSLLMKAVRKSCLCDKEAWWSQKAQEVEKASIDGRLKDTFGILKHLSLKPGRPCCILKDKDGHVLENEDQIIARWTEHFRELLKADVSVFNYGSDFEMCSHLPKNGAGII